MSGFRIIFMADNLKQKATSGIIWSSIQKFAGMGISFISGIVLARLLTPENYGCIGMLSIFMVVASSFVDGGFASALIQKKRPTQEDYSTIFFFNLGMSILMYAILFMAAPAIARFYKMPLLSSVLRVQGLVLIIQAFSLIQSNQLRKQFRFKKIAIVTLAASITSLVVTIVMAYKGFGVWALVTMNLLTAFIPAFVYWLTGKWRPLLIFSKRSFKDLFSFGFFMFLSNLINTFCNNIQGLLIGRFYNPATMGYYSKAKSTEELASTSISNIMEQVTYPLYAEYQNDKTKLVNVIKRITGSVAYITFPMMFLLILLAKPIIVLLYSERWLESVPFFQILCVAGIAICLQGVNYQAIAAIGKSRIMFRWTLIKRGVGICLVVGGLAVFGIKGLLVGMVMTSWLIYLINVHLVDRYIGYTFIQQMKDLLPILMLTVLSFCISFCMVLLFPEAGIYVLAIVRLAIFILIYLSGSKLFKMESYNYFMQNIPVIISKIKR